MSIIKNNKNYGTRVILLGEPPVPPSGYFYVEDVSGSDNTLSIVKSDFGAPTIEVFKSTDTVNWTSMGTTDTNITTTIPANSKLYLKAIENVWAYDYSNRNYITASGNFNVGGNIMSLLNGDNFENTNFGNIEKQFARLFSGSSTLISASNLLLPNNVTEFCYDGMFYDCSALTTAPALPATTLAQNCYSGMFNGCSSLTQAPELTATTLANFCYNSMFSGCTSLTEAPVLPATTSQPYCCENMFNGCSNLRKVVTYFTDISTPRISGWLNNVSATGDFYNLGGATYESGGSGIPTGWTEHTSL